MNISIFGTGNMGGAILAAVSKKSNHNICVYDVNPAKKDEYKSLDNVKFAESVAECAARADVIIICVKPMHIDSLLRDITRAGISDKTVVVSIAAGVRVERLRNVLGEQAPIVRTMPNLPASVGAGFTGVFYSNMDDASYDEVKKAVYDIFKLLGEVRVFDSETYIDKIIAVTSSSPAYVCLFAEAIADGAVRLGFKREDALVMAEQAILGTAQYLLETKTHPAVLKDMVCSPAGTTIEAVASLEESGFRAAVLQAMERCDAKTR